MHQSWSPSQIMSTHFVLNCPRSRIKPMCCVVPFPNMTHCTELCVWIFSWPICVVNTQRAWSGVCFNSVCPCYFLRVTFVWPFLVKTQPGRNTPNIKGLPAPASLLYVYLHGHPGICINRFNAWKKVSQFEREMSALYWLQHHIWGWLSTGRESLMKPLQSLGRWRPLIAIIAVMKLTIRSYLRVRARCHCNQEKLGEVNMSFSFWEDQFVEIEQYPVNFTFVWTDATCQLGKMEGFCI